MSTEQFKSTKALVLLLWIVYATHSGICGKPTIEQMCTQRAYSDLLNCGRPRETKWRYDVNRESCVQFTWSGCMRQMNQFDSEQACMNFCAEIDLQRVKQVFCTQPQDGGFCRAMITSYSYDPVTQSCDFFHYGGCGGNGNRFWSEQACMDFCAGIN